MNFYNKKLFKLDYSGKSLAIYPKNKNIKINIGLISKLKKLSKDNKNCNLRICLHKNKKDKLQNMIVLLNVNSTNEFKIHKHKSKDEVYQILDGKLKILIFKKNDIYKKFILQKNKNLILRLEKNRFHQTIPLSKVVVFHEIRQGPFSGGDSIFLNGYKKN